MILLLELSAHEKLLLLKRLEEDEEIKKEIESDGDSKISDLHIWKVAQNKYACMVSLVTAKNYSIGEYKERLNKVHELAHVTIEINKCDKKS